MGIATIEWVNLHQRCDNSRSLSAVVHVEDAVLPNELPSIDRVLCRNDNVGVDRIDDMTPTFWNVSTGRIRLFTKSPWPNNSELVLANDLLHLGIVFEEVTGLYVSRIVGKVMDLVSAACGNKRGENGKRDRDCTYPVPNLVVFQASSSCVEHIDGTLLSAGVAVVLVEIRFDVILEFLPVIVLFCLLWLDLVPLLWSKFGVDIIVEISSYRITGLRIINILRGRALGWGRCR